MRNKAQHALNGNTETPRQAYLRMERERMLAEAQAINDLCGISRNPVVLSEPLVRPKAKKLEPLGQRLDIPLEAQLPEMKIEVHRSSTPKPAVVQKKMASKDALVIIIGDRITRSALLEYEGRLAVCMYPSFEIDAPLPQYDNDPDENVPRPVKKPTQGGGNASNQRDKEKLRERAAQQDRDAFAAAENYNNSLNRVVAKLKKDPVKAVDWYNTHPESADYRKNVLEALWGKTWLHIKDMTSTQWVLYCKIMSVSHELCLERLTELFSEWVQMGQQFDVGGAWYHITGKTWADCTLVLEAERRQHNKTVHAENGNILSKCEHQEDKLSARLWARLFMLKLLRVRKNFRFKTVSDNWNKLMHSMNGNMMKSAFCHTQTEVDERDDTTKIERMGSFSTAIKYIKGSVLALRLATEPSSTSPTQLNVAANSIFRADIITAGNAVVLDQCIPLPSTSLIPREIRNGAGAALINANIPMFTKTLGPVQFVINPLMSTEVTKIIVQAAINANMNLGRADNTVLNGFNALDMAQLARKAAYYGLCMDQALVKLLLLHEIVSWTYPINTQPLTQFGVIDQYTQFDPNGTITIGYNDINNAFGENSGGATAVLPFYGGITGTIYFHLTTETVPTNQRDLAVWIPATILLQDANVDVGLALIMFIMAWAPFPTGLWSIHADTLDSAGGNPSPQIFIPLASAVQVPGQTELHIIMPRRTTAVNPANQPAANNLAILQPITGPVASTAFPVPSTPLNINFVTGPLAGYNMAELFYTWATQITATQVANMIDRIGFVTGTGPSIERCMDLISMTTQFFPFLTSAPLNGRVSFNPNSNIQFAGSSPNCISYEPVAQNWPQNGGGRADMLINATDPTAWNKVATGLAVCAEGIIDEFILPEFIGNVNNSFWSQMRGMGFATVWNSHYSNIGWSSLTWNSAYLNNQQPEFRRQIRNYYSTVAQTTRAPYNSKMGPFLANYFSSLLNARPGYSGDVKKVTVFDYIAPPTGSYNVTSDVFGNILETVIPQNLPDVWLQLMAARLPKWQSSFPNPNGPDSLKGYFKELRALAVPGNAIRGGLVDQKYYRSTVDGNETADWTDEMRWNERIMYVNVPALPSYFNATPVIGTNAAGDYPTQRPVIQAFFMAQLAGGLQITNTMSVPKTDETGNQIFALAPTAQVQGTRTALYRRTQLSVATWQFADNFAWDDELTQGEVTSKSKYAQFETNDASGKVEPSSMLPLPGGDGSGNS